MLIDCVCSSIVYVAFAVLTMKAEALQLIQDMAAKARAADAVVVAMQATAAAVVSFGFLETAKWWRKAGERVTVGTGGKEQVWRDIAAADAASIEVGMRVKVDRKGDGKSIEEATVVKADAGGGAWEQVDDGVPVMGVSIKD